MRRKLLGFILITLALCAILFPVRASGKIGLNDFESTEELTEWAKAHLTYLGENDGYTPNCVDYSLHFQYLAFTDRYRLSICLSVDGYIAPGIKVTNVMGYHSGNLAIVGASFYYIEPQPDLFFIKYIGLVKRNW